MNTRILPLLGALLAATAFGQVPSLVPPTPPTPFLKGEMSIAFNTRTQRDGDKPKMGVTDRYKLRLNVSDSVIFDGTIEAQPFVKNTFGANQPGQLTHAIECFVVNPRNTAQTRNIGRLFGTVPVRGWQPQDRHLREWERPAVREPCQRSRIG